MSEGNGHAANLSQIESEAVAWAQKLASGEATAEQRAAAERWRLRSPQHDKAYTEAEHVWSRMGAVGRVRLGQDADFTGPLREFGQRRVVMTRRMVLGGSAAAIGGVAVYGGLNPPLGLWPSVSELRADFRTATGEQRRIDFADNVAIDLNTQTSLAVRLATETEDCVELIAGEASFATADRPARALAVLAADGKIVSESGRFDVRHLVTFTDRAVSVTCFKGRIRVERGQSVAELQPGQRVRYERAGLGEIGAVDPILESEWRQGIVAFRNTPLAEAVEEINRYRPGRIILTNAALGQRLLSGRFRIDQMDRVLLQLEHTFNVKAQRLPGGIVLLS